MLNGNSTKVASSSRLLLCGLWMVKTKYHYEKRISKKNKTNNEFHNVTTFGKSFHIQMLKFSAFHRFFYFYSRSVNIITIFTP